MSGLLIGYARVSTDEQDLSSPWASTRVVQPAMSTGGPITTDRLGALDGLDRLYRNGNDVVRDCVKDEIQHLADDDSRLVSAAAATRLRSILPQPPERPVEQVPEVSKLDPSPLERRRNATSS